MDTLLQEEYKAKWQYVMHTENAQSKAVQWYFTVCAAVFMFLYTKTTEGAIPLVEERWVVLSVLFLYSLLTCLRLLAQKKNYDTYTARIREIEGNDNNNNEVRKKIISVFKLQYYAVCFVGGLVTYALSFELGAKSTAAICGAIFTAFTICLSFTRLIGK